MANSKSIKLSGIDVTVRELVVTDIISLLEADTHGSTADYLFSNSFAPFGLAGLSAVSGMGRDDLVKFTMSDLNEIYVTGKELNSHFFGALDNLDRKIQELTKKAETK
jgi:hypothetical protein